MFSHNEPYLLQKVAQYLTVHQIVNLYQSSRHHFFLSNFLIDQWIDFVKECGKNETPSSEPIRNVNRHRLYKLVYAFKYNWIRCVKEVWEDIYPIINLYPDKFFVYKIYYLCSKVCIQSDNAQAFAYLRNQICPQIVFSQSFKDLNDHKSNVYSRLAFLNTSENIILQMNYKYDRRSYHFNDLFTIVRLYYFRLSEFELIEALTTIKKLSVPRFHRKMMKLRKFFHYYAPKNYRYMANFLEI